MTNTLCPAGGSGARLERASKAPLDRASKSLDFPRNNEDNRGLRGRSEAHREQTQLPPDKRLREPSLSEPQKHEAVTILGDRLMLRHLVSSTVKVCLESSKSYVLRSWITLTAVFLGPTSPFAAKPAGRSID